MSQELKFTPGVRQQWLENFRTTGNVRLACEAVGISRSTILHYREADPEFAKAYADAEEDAADHLEDAAYKRAVNGVDRRRYDKDGNCIAEETVYSDTLLLALLKARRPTKFRDNSKLELTGANGGPVAVTDETKRASKLAGLLALARGRRDNEPLG